MSSTIEEKYDFYLKHVPQSVSTLFNHSSDELDRIRKEIIKSHRIISISGILESTAKENKNILSGAIKSPHKFVLNPAVLDATSHIPLLASQSASLYSYIHSNTSYLVNALLKCKDSKEFNYLALSAVPSLFGFYSSNEHISLSMRFFIELFNSTDNLPHILPFLIPFFSAPCLYRYFESSLVPFFDYFVRDTQKFDDNVINKYSQMLTECFISSAPLIPRTHVVLLKIMHEKFGELETHKFFFEELLKNQIFRWLESVSTKIPKEYVSLVQNKKEKKKNKELCEGDVIARKLIELIFNNTGQTLILKEILNADKGSLIEVPFLYTVFEDSFLYFLVSISDVRALYHLLIENKYKLLTSMTIIDTQKVDENYVFWMKTYPSHMMETQLTKVPLIFEECHFQVPQDDEKERKWRAIDNLAYEREVDPMQIVSEINAKNNENDIGFTNYALSKCLENSIELADTFEQFLFQMYNLNSSKKWQKISTLHEYIILLPIVKSLVIEKNKLILKSNYDSNNYKGLYTNLFGEVSSELQSPLIKRYQYLFIIQRIIPKILSDSMQDFCIIKERLSQIFQRNLSTFETLNSSLNNPRLNVFWEAVELIRTTECEDLPYQFTNLIRGLSLIYHLSINTKSNYNYKNIGGGDDQYKNIDSIDLNIDDDDDYAKDERTKMFLKSALYLSCTERTKIFDLYMIISLFCISDHQFRSLCTEHELRLWVIFENVLLSIIINDEEASEKYTAITSRFNPQ